MPELPWIYNLCEKYYVRDAVTQEIIPLFDSEDSRNEANTFNSFDKPGNRLVFAWRYGYLVYEDGSHEEWPIDPEDSHRYHRPVLQFQGIAECSAYSAFGVFTTEEGKTWCVDIEEGRQLDISGILQEVDLIMYNRNVRGRDFSGNQVAVYIDGTIVPQNYREKGMVSDDGMKCGPIDYPPFYLQFPEPVESHYCCLTRYRLFATKSDGRPLIYHDDRQLNVEWNPGRIVSMYRWFCLVETPNGSYSVYMLERDELKLIKNDVYYEAPTKRRAKAAY